MCYEGAKPRLCSISFTLNTKNQTCRRKTELRKIWSCQNLSEMLCEWWIQLNGGRTKTWGGMRTHHQVVPVVVCVDLSTASTVHQETGLHSIQEHNIIALIILRVIASRSDTDERHRPSTRLLLSHMFNLSQLFIIICQYVTAIHYNSMIIAAYNCRSILIIINTFSPCQLYVYVIFMKTQHL